VTSPNHTWNPGFNRTEDTIRGGDPSKLGSWTHEALHHGTTVGWQGRHILGIPPHVRKKKLPPPPRPPPPPKKDVPVWKQLRGDDSFGDLDLVEAVGTLELALYIPVTLPWLKAGARRRGRRPEGHTAGFLTTLSDLSNSVDSLTGVHSRTGQADYEALLKSLVVKTNAIAMMVDRSSVDPLTQKEAQKATPSPALLALMGQVIPSVQFVSRMQPCRPLDSIYSFYHQVKEIMAAQRSAVDAFRQFDDNGDGTLDPKEFQAG
jgi:hypothetical protein